MGTCNSTLAHGETCVPVCDTGLTLVYPTSSSNAGSNASGTGYNSALPVGGYRRTTNISSVMASCDLGNLTEVVCDYRSCENVTIPENSQQGNCSSTLLEGDSCQPVCDRSVSDPYSEP